MPASKMRASAPLWSRWLLALWCRVCRLPPAQKLRSNSIGLAARGADREQLAENIGPAGQRHAEQQRHDQLHDQVRVGDQG
jgi:hypothetical protein